MGLFKTRYSIIAFIALGSCRHHTPEPYTGYPENVDKIITTKCATSGCHNAASYTAAANLNLNTWEGMFKGANSGAVVIPYRADFSPLCYFINVDSVLGISLQPTMPLNQQPLSKDEYLLLKEWIISGAPDAAGHVKCSGNPSRKKFYVTNRLCDVVTVFDAGSYLQMRYVDVGIKQETEFPIAVQVAPDRKHWFTSFFSTSDIIQKFDAEADKLVGNINLGAGLWYSFAITSDSRYGFFVDRSNIGRVAYVDLLEMKLLAMYDLKGKYPSGIVINETMNRLYVGSSSGNFIYSIDISDPHKPFIELIPVDGSNSIHEESNIGTINLTSDGVSRCFIACERSGEIRVLDMATNKIMPVFNLGTNPAFMSYSTATKTLFVSCPDDRSFPGNRGAVVVIDIAANTIVKKIKTGYQPYGLAVDDERGVVAVVNANISSEGPASHHTSGCGQKNGNVTFIDLKTLELVPKIKREVAVFPFGVAAR